MKQLTIKLETIFERPVSRSQAREVLKDAQKFQSLIMDYEAVPEIGQAFADEIYRVFQNTYPDIVIREENMFEGVRFMVERAKSEAKKN